MTADKLEALKENIFKKKRLMVAFSGGVDSSLLAKIAQKVLGDDSLSIIIDSETMPRSEIKKAEKLAKLLGLNYRIERLSVLADENFTKNPRIRCYICKKRSMGILSNIAGQLSIGCIADGVNLNDYNDYRPGIKACDEEGIWHPFVEAEITKEEIRKFARILGLANWNKPSSACLASRIPYGEQITSLNLKMVEEAEEHLMNMGFYQVRVRAHNNKMARIELQKTDMKDALNCGDEIAKKLIEIGFKYVSLDLQGFRSGSMNDALWTSKK